MRGRGMLAVVFLGSALLLVACAGQPAASSGGQGGGVSNSAAITEPQAVVPQDQPNLPQDIIGRWARTDDASRTWTFSSDGTGNQDGSYEFTWKSLEPGKITVTGSAGNQMGGVYSITDGVLSLGSPGIKPYTYRKQ